MHYLSKRQENILHLSKVAPKKLWRQILTRKTKEDNKIDLKDWNSYLKMLYESPDIKDNIQILLFKFKSCCDLIHYAIMNNHWKPMSPLGI